MSSIVAHKARRVLRGGKSGEEGKGGLGCSCLFMLSCVRSESRQVGNEEPWQRSDVRRALSRRRGGRTKEGRRTYIHNPNPKPRVRSPTGNTADYDMAVQQEKKKRKSCLTFWWVSSSLLHRGGAKRWQYSNNKTNRNRIKLRFTVHSDRFLDTFASK